MKTLNRREWIAAWGGAFLASCVVSTGRAEGKKVWATTPPRERLRKRYFPDLVLTAHNGEKVRFYEDLIKDKTVVINFMYSNCNGVCPGIMCNLASIRELMDSRVGKDIFFYSLTLKPKEDTAEVLQKYAETLNLKPGWLLLTGEAEDMERLRLCLGFSDPDPEVDKDTSNHIGNLRYGNEPQMRWASCPGLSDPEWVVKLVQDIADIGRQESA